MIAEVGRYEVEGSVHRDPVVKISCSEDILAYPMGGEGGWGVSPRFNDLKKTSEKFNDQKSVHFAGIFLRNRTPKL